MTQYVRNWDPEVVDKYIKPESQQKSPDVFRKTHVEIDKIQAEILRPHSGDNEFVSEAQFRDAVLDSELRDDNRIFIIKGEVGSGKSHLCQWLEYEINGYGDESGYDDTHVAIHISRSNTRLDEILEILHEPIDKEYEEVSDVSALDPIEVADFIIQGLRTFYKDRSTLQNFDLDAFLQEYEQKDDFRTILIENIREYQESVEQEGQEQDIKEYLLSRRDYGRICLSTFGETRREDDVYPFIRRAVHDLLTRNIGIEDFKRELEELSEAYVDAGKRPVLICEDLTTFSVLKDDLLDHIFELSSGHYDVIMGWTTGWERENIDDALSTSEDSLTYMKQRTQGYLSMTDESGQAYFLEGRSAPVVLVRKYLEAIKEESDVDAEVPEEPFDNIYPFNEAFIRHVYANLVQDGNLQQTPRILLVHVIADCLTSNVPPFRAVQNNSYVRRRPYLISIDEHSDPCLELTQWYAMKHEEQLWLPIGVFEAFDVDTHDAPVDDGYAFFEPTFAAGDVNVIEHQPGDTDLPEIESEPDLDGVEPEDPEEAEEDVETEEETTEEDEVEEKPSSESRTVVPPEDYREFQSWLINGDEYESVDRFREGVIATLERWHDPTQLGNENSTAPGMSVYYARGSEPPIYVKGADAYSSMSFEIPHGTEHEGLYRQMLRYGYEEQFGADANFDQLRGWADDKVVEFRRQMREDIEGHLPAEMTIEEFIVLTHFLVMNVGKGVTEVSKELVFNEYQLESTSPVSRDSDLEVDLPPGLEDTFRDLTVHTKDIRRLAHGFFLLKRNVVDHHRLEEAVEGVSENMNEYINELATVSVDDLADAYRIGSTRRNAEKQLSTVIEDVSNFAGELEKFEQDVEIDEIREGIERYHSIHSDGHDREKLAEVYDLLDESLGPLEITQREQWREVGQLLDEGGELNIDDFRNTLNQIAEADSDDAISLIALFHDYQRSLDKHNAWGVYDALTEMIRALERADSEDVGSFRRQVRDSSEFDAFRQKRESVTRTIEGVQ